MEKWGGTDGDLRREHSSRGATLKAKSKFLAALARQGGTPHKSICGGKAATAEPRSQEARLAGPDKVGAADLRSGRICRARGNQRETLPEQLLSLVTGEQRPATRFSVRREAGEAKAAAHRALRVKAGPETCEGTSRRTGKQPSPRDTETSKAVSPGETQAHTGRDGALRSQVQWKGGHQGKRAR